MPNQLTQLTTHHLMMLLLTILVLRTFTLRQIAIQSNLLQAQVFYPVISC